MQRKLNNALYPTYKLRFLVRDGDTILSKDIIADNVETLLEFRNPVIECKI